jgi:hypothetical protein
MEVPRQGAEARFPEAEVRQSSAHFPHGYAGNAHGYAGNAHTRAENRLGGAKKSLGGAEIRLLRMGAWRGGVGAWFLGMSPEGKRPKALLASIKVENICRKKRFP